MRSTSYRIYEETYINNINGDIEIKFKSINLKPERENRFFSEAAAIKYIEKNPDKFFLKELVILPHYKIEVKPKKEDDENS